MKGRLGRVRSIAMNEKCGWILAAYSSWFGNEIILWDLSTCEMVGRPIMVNQVNERSYLACAAVNLNGNMIVTGSSDGTLQRYYATTGDAIGEPMRRHKCHVTCVRFGLNDEIIVSGSRDNSIIRWVPANGKQIGNPLLHGDSVTRFSISGDGNVIMSTTYGGNLYRWDTISGQRIGKPVFRQCRVSVIWTNYDGTEIVILATDRTITWWSVEPEGAIRGTSTLPLSTDIEECAIDMNHGVAALGLRNGAVALCDIHL